MQSYNGTPDWLRMHVWDCDACCQLANGLPAEPELLLRGVAWNRVSWVFSLSVPDLLVLSLSPATRSAFALIDSVPPSLPPSLYVYIFLKFYTCKRGKSTCTWNYSVYFTTMLCVDRAKAQTPYLWKFVLRTRTLDGGRVRVSFQLFMRMPFVPVGKIPHYFTLGAPQLRRPGGGGSWKWARLHCVRGWCHVALISCHV